MRKRRTVRERTGLDMIPLLGWSGFRTETVDIAILCTTTIWTARRANEKQCEASPFVVTEYRYTDLHAWSSLCWVMLHSERFSKLTCATARPTSLCERAANQPRSQSRRRNQTTALTNHSPLVHIHMKHSISTHTSCAVYLFPASVSCSRQLAAETAPPQRPIYQVCGSRSGTEHRCGVVSTPLGTK